MFEDKEGRCTRDHARMAQIAKLYFEDLFTSRHGLNDMSFILSCVNECISTEDNFELKSAFSREEILMALKEMRPIKAPSIDSFQHYFIKVLAYCG